jgi:uncharacterized protein (TIGR00730 family)
MKRVCVFCGSSVGVRPEYMAMARKLGETLARRGLGLVYGGASVGLMGAVADAALSAGGEVIGVLPRSLQKREIAHLNLTELHIVDSMHTRKAMMAERADAFIALPGGLGTMEELFEVLTWRLLGIHRKPAGLLDVAGYYQKLSQFLEHTMAEGFLRPEQLSLHLAEDPDALLDALAASPPREVDHARRDVVQSSSAVERHERERHVNVVAHAVAVREQPVIACLDAHAKAIEQVIERADRAHHAKPPFVAIGVVRLLEEQHRSAAARVDEQMADDRLRVDEPYDRAGVVGLAGVEEAGREVRGAEDRDPRFVERRNRAAARERAPAVAEPDVRTLERDFLRAHREIAVARENGRFVVVAARRTGGRQEHECERDKPHFIGS